MNRKKIIYSFCLSALLLLLIVGSVSAQFSDKLKDYLWQNDMQVLIRKYAQERVILHEDGNIARRIARRSYSEKEGLRVQVFAGTEEQHALDIAAKTRDLNLDSVYVNEDAGMFKVQLGNFTKRLEAEKMLDRLRFAGITNAWIVKTQVHIPKSGSIIPHEIPAAKEENGEILYSIQLFVTNNREKAEQLKRDFAVKIGASVWILPQGNLWKVLAGKYGDEEQARQRLSELQTAGFPDAWLTQVEQ